MTKQVKPRLTAEGLATGNTRDASKFLRYVPGQSNWQIRLLFERHVKDGFSQLMDPRDFDQRNRKHVRKMRTQGQSYYWEPGDSVPERMPDLGKAVAKPKKTYSDVAESAVDAVTGSGRGNRSSSGYTPTI